MNEFQRVEKSEFNRSHIANISDFNGKRRTTTKVKKSNNTAESEVIATSEYKNSGGGGGMDDLLRRLDNLEKEVSSKSSKQDLETLELKIKLETSHQTTDLKDFMREAFSNALTEDRVKSVIDEKSKGLDLATNTYVREQVHKSNNKLLLWLGGITITVVLGVIRLFMK